MSLHGYLSGILGAVASAPAAPLRTATMLQRVGAYVFDTLLITLAVAAVFYLFLGFDQTLATYMERGADDGDVRLRFIIERSAIRTVSLVLYLAYATVAEASPLRGTVGKWLLSLQVVTLHDQPLDLRTSVVRNAGKLASLITIIGVLVALRSPIRQTWHDRWAGTRVVHVPVP